jgi:hypothetical protein
MAQCDELIKAAIEKNCVSPIVQGFERVGYIINKEDIDNEKITYSESNPNTISTLPLKSGKKAYKIYQPNEQPFKDANTKLAKGSVGGYADNEIAFVIPDKGPAISSDIIDPLMNGEFVVILENKAKHIQATSNPGDSAFQIFGLFNGLTLSEGSQEPYSDDTMSGWSVKLKESKCPKSAMFLNAGTYETTKALLEALIVTA